MSLKQLSDYTFVSKYAKYLPKEKRRETVKESVARYREMMEKKYSAFDIKEELDFACSAYEELLVLGSNRSLQFAGPAIEKHNTRGYNCWGSYCDRLRFFQESMYILLCGGGVGFSVQQHHVAKLPDFSKNKRIEDKVWIIEDSIEGWADAVGVLLSTYFRSPVFPDFAHSKVIFDYSAIRPEGSSFSHGIGKAPGHKPLERSIEKIRALLDNAVLNNSHIKPIDCYDIVMYISDAVLSGGIRRSATLAVFSFDDKEMMGAKTGNWMVTHPHRARSNNSCILLRRTTTWEQFNSIIESTKQYGEPAFIWADSYEQLFNPCLEIGFYCYNSKGQSGWQACNLSTQNGKKIRNRQDWERSIRAATILGTFQAGFTDFPYLGSVTEEICRRESLLGVSLTGWLEHPDLLLNPKLQQEMAATVLRINKELAKKININPAARAACIKPEGTSASFLGTFSGCHAGNSEDYIRYVQENELSRPAQYYKEINPIAISKSVWSENKSDLVIAFPCELSGKPILKKHLTAIQFLEIVKNLQINWVWSGRDLDLCTKPFLMHNVSNTCVVKPDEWDDVAKFIYDNREYFTAVSLLSSFGDKDYAQAPFTEIHRPEELVSIYGDGCMFASGLIEEGIRAFDGDLWKACSCALDKGEDISKKEHNDYAEEKRLSKEKWIGRLKKFARKYYKNDLTKTTYLLKDVYNWKYFVDLKKETKEVNYLDMIEEENTTVGTKEVACGGGACLI